MFEQTGNLPFQESGKVIKFPVPNDFDPTRQFDPARVAKYTSDWERKLYQTERHSIVQSTSSRLNPDRSRAGLQLNFSEFRGKKLLQFLDERLCAQDQQSLELREMNATERWKRIRHHCQFEEDNGKYPFFGDELDLPELAARIMLTSKKPYFLKFDALVEKMSHLRDTEITYDQVSNLSFKGYPIKSIH